MNAEQAKCINDLLTDIERQTNIREKLPTEELFEVHEWESTRAWIAAGRPRVEVEEVQSVSSSACKGCFYETDNGRCPSIPRPDRSCWTKVPDCEGGMK